MPKTKRFLLFVIGGTLALTLWAVLFGAATSVPFSLVALQFQSELASEVNLSFLWFVKKIISPAWQFGLGLFTLAFLLIPQQKNDLREVIRCCVLRSLVCAPLLSFLGSATVLTIIHFTKTSQANPSLFPSSFFNFFAVFFVLWFPGFFAGLVWGTIESILRLRKTAAPSKQVPIPPLAVP